MLRRIRTLIIKEFRQLARNKLIALLILLGPLTEMTLIGWTTAAPITYLPTAVVDLDRSAASRALLTALANTDTFSYDFFLDSPFQLSPYIEDGDAVAGIIIPKDYGRRLLEPGGRPAEVAFVLDGAHPRSATEALNSARGTVEDHNRELVIRWNDGREPPGPQVNPQVRVRYNEEMKESVYTVPSELGLILFAVTLVLAGISIAREREGGTLERLMVTPLRRVELVIAKSAPAVLMAYIVFLSMLTVAILAFDIPMRGSWSLLLLTAFLFILVELGIGLMISSYARNQMQGLLMAFTWIIIEFFFSGYGVPVENMPEILQAVAPIFPIYHWMIIFRSILLKGVGVSAFWPHLLAGFAIGTVVLLFTIWLLGRQQWE